MIKQVLRSPVFAGILFALGIVLVLVGTIGTIQAAPRIQSKDWKGEVKLTDIRTSLLENGATVASKDIGEGSVNAPGGGVDRLLGEHFLGYNDLDSASDFMVGATYKEELSVVNDGTNERAIDEYVRVTVYKFWVDDETGNKCTDLDPDYIELNFVEGGGWTIDADASTPERTVLYYSGILAKGQPTSNFTDTLKINQKVLSDPKYNGKTFRIEAVVDAVQTHSASPAKISAWGQDK